MQRATRAETKGARALCCAFRPSSGSTTNNPPHLLQLPQAGTAELTLEPARAIVALMRLDPKLLHLSLEETELALHVLNALELRRVRAVRHHGLRVEVDELDRPAVA